MSIILEKGVAHITRDISMYPYYGGENALNEDGSTSWRSLIPSRDKIKRQKGFRLWYETYQDLLRDPHLRSVDQKRRMAVITRPWDIVPYSQAPEDQKVAAFVKQAISEIGQRTGINQKRKYAIARRFDGFTTACYKLLSAYYYGFSVGEVIWGTTTKRAGGKVRKFAVPKEIRSRNQERFGAALREDDEYELLLFTKERPMGESLAEDKFIVCFYDEDEMNPLGFGTAPCVYYPIDFKRRLVQFSLAYADRFGSPQMIGTYPGTQEHIKKTLEEYLQKLGQGGYAVVPEGINITPIAVGGQGNQLYEQMIEFFNREISKTILGETGTTDQQGSGGSRARDQVGNDVRLEIAYADAMLLADTLNTSLVPWIVYYNFGPDVGCPSIQWSFPEVGNSEDLDALVMRMGQITQIMQQRPPEKWVEEKFGIPLESVQGAGGAEGGLAALFGGEPAVAEGDPNTPEGAIAVPGAETLENPEVKVGADGKPKTTASEPEPEEDELTAIASEADALTSEEESLEEMEKQVDSLEDQADDTELQELGQALEPDLEQEDELDAAIGDLETEVEDVDTEEFSEEFWRAVKLADIRRKQTKQRTKS